MKFNQFKEVITQHKSTQHKSTQQGNNRIFLYCSSSEQVNSKPDPILELVYHLST